ncbi:MAG: ATP-grasp domain-containing protein [Deltaproteobacteria bacterium]|nr:ATP-grasp domain-containing protein [Deltaproteobacteria bacterium]
MKNKKTILVTGIGGNVGQGILRNTIAHRKSIRIVGVNVETVTAGTHLCDVVYQVPFAYDKKYIPEIRRICKEERVDCIIPSTDYETVYLSKNRRSLPTIATSSYDVNLTFLDKYRTWQKFTAHGIPFAETALPSEYKGVFNSDIIKPREGRGSRGIVYEPKNIKKYPDSFVVQKLYKGIELPTAFYVTKSGELHSMITFSRELLGGMTVKCTVDHTYDKQLLIIIRQMMKHFTIRGSCNIQSIATIDGRVIPFEINGRISGTNSIRSQFGFTDVAWTIDEYLYNKKPKPARLAFGSAVRIQLDVIYPDVALKDIKNKNTKHYIF